MTVERFNSLTLSQQCYYTVKCAVYLASFHDVFLSSDLYQSGNFYIEVFYEQGNMNCCMARAFTETFALNKYLHSISIEELL
jgi:hypothetical protein